MKKLIAIIFMLTSVCYGAGYVGTLPDVTRSFAPSEPRSVKPVFEEVENFYSPNQVKPVPRDNPTFVNIIMKKDKTSQYLNDLNEFIPMLEKIYDSIEDKENVQLFNAKVYFFNKNADFMREKYLDKPESEYISFKKLMELSSHSQTVATLRSEAQKYNPYLAYGGAGYIYDPNNIDEQLNFLKIEIEQAILLLKEAD